MNPVPRTAIALEPNEIDMFFPGPRGGADRLRAILPEAKFFNPNATAAAWNQWLRAECPEIIVSGWSTPRIPDELASLRYVCHIGGSVRNTVSRQTIERGVQVTNWGDSVSEGLAEAALLLGLSALRRSHYFADRMHRQRGWASFPAGTKTLFECRVGIHGFGAAARKLVGLLAPFRVRLAAYSASVPAQHFVDAGVEQCRSLEALFASSDILFEMEGLTPATTRIVTEQILRLMPHDAALINVARGALIDEEAATRLAAEGRIRLALDVYTQEPLPAGSPLRDLPEVVLFPHLGSPTSDRLYQCGDYALANLGRYLRGEPLIALVSPDIYDRST